MVTADPAAPGDSGPRPSGSALVEVAVPEVVVRRAPDGAVTAYLVPRTPGVRWVVDGLPVADVATSVDGHWRLDASPDEAPDVVVAVAEAGHRLLREDGTTAVAVAALDRRVAVEAVRPEVVDGDAPATRTSCRTWRAWSSPTPRASCSSPVAGTR
ncbi:hypothetical protein BJF88_09925 [Cellulosimicrobium sp. CUA-896]|nr:hypothetical protein BJF88_09925 [Cellulosimicrobium sp. CUA-896]